MQPPDLKLLDVDLSVVEVLSLIPMDTVGMIERPANTRQHDYDHRNGGKYGPIASFGSGLSHDFSIPQYSRLLSFRANEHRLIPFLTISGRVQQFAPPEPDREDRPPA